MQQLLRYGRLPRSKIGLVRFVAGSSDQCFHTWGLRSSLIRVHSGFAWACSQRPLWDSLILGTSPIAACQPGGMIFFVRLIAVASFR